MKTNYNHTYNHNKKFTSANSNPYNFVFDYDNLSQNSNYCTHPYQKMNMEPEPTKDLESNLKLPTNDFLRFVEDVIILTSLLFASIINVGWIVSLIMYLTFNNIGWVVIVLMLGICIIFITGVLCYKYSLDDSVQCDAKTYYKLDGIPKEKKIILIMVIVGFGLITGPFIKLIHHHLTQFESIFSLICLTSLIGAIGGFGIKYYNNSNPNILSESVNLYQNKIIEFLLKLYVLIGFVQGIIGFTISWNCGLVIMIINIILMPIYLFQLHTNITDCTEMFNFENTNIDSHTDMTKCCLMNLLRFYSLVYDIGLKIIKH